MFFMHQIPSLLAGQGQNHLSQVVTVHFTHKEKENLFNPPKIKGQSASDTKRGSWKKYNSWMERDLRISSKDSAVPKQIWSITTSLSHVWKRRGVLQKEGKLCQGERLTVVMNGVSKQIREIQAGWFWILHKVEGTGSFPTKAAGVCGPFFGAQSTVVCGKLVVGDNAGTVVLEPPLPSATLPLAHSTAFIARSVEVASGEAQRCSECATGFVTSRS